jgi:hypothetical protein
MASRQYEQLDENSVQKDNRPQSAKSCSCPSDCAFAKSDDSTSVSGYSSGRDDEFDGALFGTTKSRGRNINRDRGNYFHFQNLFTFNCEFVFS